MQMIAHHGDVDAIVLIIPPQLHDNAHRHHGPNMTEGAVRPPG